MENLWTGSFTVRAGEADLYGRASLRTLSQYLEEAAYRHADRLGFSYHPMREKGVFWVLFRMRLEVDRYPQWTEEVELETWARGFSRLFARRDFLIRDARSQVIGRASSQWLLLGLENRRPVRPETVFSMPAEGTERSALPADPGAAPQATSYSESHRIAARYGDLDVNRHVNHTRYVEWALNCMEPGWYAHRTIRTLQMEYLEETRDSCPIRLEKGPLDSRSLAIRAVREDTGKAVFHAFLQWDDTPIPCEPTS